jgi:hypothetical protein
MASGMPTHFDDSDGRALAIDTYLHLPSDHLRAAREAGLCVEELHEGVVDDEWLRREPRRARFREWPVGFAWRWRTPGTPGTA